MHKNSLVLKHVAMLSQVKTCLVQSDESYGQTITTVAATFTFVLLVNRLPDKWICPL